MRFNRFFPAAAAVGVAGALALGGAATAHAAIPAASTQEARLTGKFVFGPEPASNWKEPYLAADSYAYTLGYFPTQAAAQQVAPTITIPAVGTTGKIMLGDKCLGAATPTQGDVHASFFDCASPSAVDFTIQSDGRASSSYGFLDINTNNYAPLILNGLLASSESLDMAGFEPAATKAVAVSGPADGSTVTSRRPTITGTGDPGATIAVTTQSGKNLGTTTVGADGNWTLTPTSDIAANNPTLTATQTIAGGTTTTTTVSFIIQVADQALTAQVTSVDAGAQTATVSGTGKAGDTITISGPNGNQTVTVGADGNWTVTISGLADGDNTITITDGVDTLSITATMMPSPIVNPIVAGGAGLAALLALGTTMITRRKAIA
jgi:hypothetical protein